MAEQVHVSFPILKFDRTPDGDLIVYGKCTDGSVDADHQIVDSKWSAKALGDWLSSGGNMRVQHSPFLYPAGKGLALEMDRDGDSGHWLKALVVKDTPAHGLVEKRILRDFSIGILDPQIVFDSHAAPGGTIKGGKIGEVSLVDRGSNKNTTFQIAKSAGDGGIELVARLLSVSPMAKMVMTSPGQLNKKKGKKKLVDSGGRDVSDVPDGDFAGPGHTFPIKTPDDVPDAASLAHHADNPSAVRSKIKDIAERKFGTDEDNMPPSLQNKSDPDGDGSLTKSDGPACSLCDGKGTIRDGKVVCPDCHGSKTLQPDLAKGDAAQDYPGDADADDDEEDDDPGDDGKDNGSGASSSAQKAAMKSLKRAVRRQRRILKGDAQRGNSGGRTPADATGHADSGHTDAPFTTAKDKDMVPAGKHREPDGAQVEGIEADAGMDSSHESGDQTGVPGSKWGKKAKKKGKKGTADVPGSNWDVTKSAPSYGMQRLHDATCPAYRWGQVRKGYGLPRDVGAAVPVREIETLAMDAITKGSMAEAAYFTQMLEVAASMQQVGPDVLLDARKALPAMFPTAHPAQRSDVRPSQFQGGYISSGHPSLSAGSESGHTALPNATVHSVSANDFKRGYLDSGRADVSPGEGTQARASTAAFGGALASIGAMHSRVTALWPGMCPINVTQRDYTTGEGNTGIKPSKLPSLPAVPGATKAVQVDLRKALADSAVRIKELEEENAILGALPDPEQAPYRGLPQLDGPVDRDSFVGKVLGDGGAETETEGDDAEFLEFINGIAASGDPGMRLSATKVLRGLLTK